MSCRSYESDPELKPGMHSQVEVKVESPISGNAQQPIAYHPTTSDVVEASVVEQASMEGQVELKVENPISNAYVISQQSTTSDAVEASVVEQASMEGQVELKVQNPISNAYVIAQQPTTSDVVEASVVEQASMEGQVELKVENPISNAYFISQQSTTSDVVEASVVEQASMQGQVELKVENRISNAYVIAQQPTTSDVVEASIVEQASMQGQVELKVENPISNAYVISQQSTTSDVVEASVVEQASMQGQVELKVENPISNAYVTAQQRGEKEDLLRLRLKLYKAALRGDWNAAEAALRSNKSAGCLAINGEGEGPLHVAALAKQTEFVHKLVEYLNEGDLQFKNKFGATAFFPATLSGDVEIAKVMYDKNRTLPTIRNGNDMTPFEVAAWMGNRKMVEFHCKITRLQDLEVCELMNILVATIDSEMYDIALNILISKEGTSIFTSPNEDKGRPLHALARKPLSHYGTSQEWICESLARIVPYVPCFKRIYGSIEKRRQAGQLVKKLFDQILTLEDSEILNLFIKTPILNDAVKIGNVEFLTLLIRSYPDLIRTISNHYSIFHVAVIWRQEKVFSLIYHTGAVIDLLVLLTDGSKNNILHLAANLAPSSRLNSVSGAALQMQRELLWFKKVEEILRPSDVQNKNNKDKTPRELFTEQHEKLREAGEKWMKDTATSCMVVATLIATVTFAAAFTVPGGDNEKTGAPILLNDRWFTVFVAYDAVAMFSSTASLMMFLSILTSRYAEDDFLFTLPTKLMGGLVALFASIVCMVLAFTATFFLVYEKENEGKLPTIVAGLALLPITLHAMLNFRLWISLIHSTIWQSSFMFRPGKHKLFLEKDLQF